MIYTWFSNHQGVVTLRRIGCLDTYGLDLWLRWSGLLLLILSVVILIVVDSHSVSGTSQVEASSAVILRSRAASSDLCCFNSSSLPHTLEMMASSCRTSVIVQLVSCPQTREFLENEIFQSTFKKKKIRKLHSFHFTLSAIYMHLD